MDTDLQKQIESRILGLPQDLQDAILSSDLSSHIQTIGQKHQLHIDQIGILQDETMLVMLGFTEPDTFSSQLSLQLKIPSEKAGAISDAINSEIFMPIRESLKKLTANTDGAGEKAPKGDIPAPIPQKSSQGPAMPNPADVMLTTKTVSTPPSSPATLPTDTNASEAPKAPPQYKTDPYREPPL